jgi:hypothetical protein
MNYKKYWAIFIVVQIVGAIGWAIGSPHRNPVGLFLGLTFLFPGTVVCLALLETTGRGTASWAFIALSIFVIVAWSLLGKGGSVNTKENVGQRSLICNPRYLAYNRELLAT